METPWGRIEVQTRQDMPQGTVLLVDREYARRNLSAPALVRVVKMLGGKAGSVVENIGQEESPAPDEEAGGEGD